MNIIIEEIVSEFPIEILEEVVQITISDAVSYFDIVEIADTSFVGKDGYVPVVNETTGKLVLSPQSGGGGGGLTLGETSTTAYRGDRGKTAYDHSQDITTNPHNVTKSQVGLESVDNTSDVDKPISNATQGALDDKVDKITGKGLSTEDYTTTEKSKLAGIESNAEVNNISDANATDLTDGNDTTLHTHDSRYYTETEVDNFINDKFDNPTGDNTQYLDGAGTPTIFPTIPSIAGLATTTYVDAQDNLKVDKVIGYGLSKNDLTDILKTKLDGIEAGAEVNVNADWNAVSGDAQILNKPTIPSISGLATEAYADAKVEDAIVDGVTTKAPSQNAVFDALDLKANLTQVGNLLREEFTFTGLQTFTLANNYGQVYSVEVQGQGALSTSQYTLVAPNQITINDALDSDDYVVVIYSNAIAGIQPYYSQSEVDALLDLKQNKEFSYKATTPVTITGIVAEFQLARIPLPPGSFNANDLMNMVGNFTKSAGTSTVTIRYKLSTSATMPVGSVDTIAIFGLGLSNRFAKVLRGMSIYNNVLTGYPFGATVLNDFAVTNNFSSVAFDTTIQYYFYVAANLGTATDDLTMQSFQLTNK